MNHTHTSEPRVGLSRRLPLPSFVLSTIVLAMAFALCMGPIVSHAFAQDEPAPPVMEDELGPPPPPADQDEPPLPPADDQNPPAQPAAELEAPAQPAAAPGEPGQPAAEPDEFGQPGADQEQAAPPEAAEEPERPPQPAADASGGIVLNFKDATLDAVLEYLSEAAGFVVVKDITVLGRITVISQQPVSAEEAVGLLNTILKDKGYMAVRMGRTLKVALLSDARKANLPVRSGNDPEAIMPSDSFVTQVIPLRFVDAAKLKQDLASLISTYADLSANAASNSLILTDTEANIRRIVEIVQALDMHPGTVADIKVFQLQYANATSVAKLINDVFKEETTTQQQTSPFGGSRRFRMPGGEESSTSSDDRRKEKVVASADDRTNTVVVSASTEVLKVIESMIRELDSNPAAEQAVLIYRLKNAKAANLAKVLNDLFTVRSSTGQTTSGASRGQSSQGPGGFISRMMAQQGASTAAQTTDLAGQVYFVADADTNSIMVMTASGNFERVRLIIDEMDRSVPQVLIKVLLAEVTRTNSKDLGVEFSALNLRPSGRGSQVFSDFNVGAGGNGLTYKLLEKDVTAALRVLQTVGKLDVLSRPYILASDNQAAKITVGETVPFIRSSRTTGETGQTINDIEWREIGIILNVTPHINPEGLVILDVAPEISAITGDTVQVSDTVSYPVYAKRSASSRVAIHNGQTIVIGGLMQDKKTENIRKVPLLGDIPLLGALFRRTTTDLTKTELLIFLTPHVAQESASLEEMSADEMSGSKVVPNAVAPGTFNDHMEGLQRGATPQENGAGR